MIRIASYWIAILFLQFVVFNHLGLSTHLVPQVFIVLLITLPVYIPKIYQVLIAFGLGLLADMFVGTPGIHASACMWLMVIRMFIFRAQDLKEQTANRLSYTVQNVGLTTFSYTAITLVLLYHLYVFWLESIGAINWNSLFLTTIVSSTFSLTIISIVQFLSSKSSVEK